MPCKCPVTRPVKISMSGPVGNESLGMEVTAWKARHGSAVGGLDVFSERIHGAEEKKWGTVRQDQTDSTNRPPL